MVRRAWFHRKRPKPKPKEDRFGKAIQSWSGWQDPVKDWVFKCSRNDGGWERQKFRGTYAEMIEKRKALLGTNLYWMIVSEYKEG